MLVCRRIGTGVLSMADDSFDLIVIGGGPGGYVAGIRAAQSGLRVAVVEKRTSLGGVCLNEGCIPSKALLDSSEHFAFIRDKSARHGVLVSPPVLDLPQMMARKEEIVKKLTDGIAFLFKKNRVKWLSGSGRLLAQDFPGKRAVEIESGGARRTVWGERVLLATGSVPAGLSSLPWDGATVVGARECLAFRAVPEHLVVIGAGYVGLELGSVWKRLGAQVTVIEMLPQLLPHSDREVSAALMRSLKKQGFNFRLGARITGADVRDAKAVLRMDVRGESEEIVCDKVLVAVGRKPATAGLGIDEAGVALDDDGRICVDEDYQTSTAGIYAIGDLVPGPMLAHKASEEGSVFVERIAGKAARVNYATLPGVVYSWPEAASVGRTEEGLKSEGVAYRSGKSSFLANGRAQCMDEIEGFVKILSHQKSDKVLGVHVVGPRASDLIAEAVAVMAYGGTSRDISAMFHAHPTLAEAFKEAALDVFGLAVHS